MAIRLTEQQQRALDSTNTELPQVVDPRTNAAYVLIPLTEYEAIREVVEDGREAIMVPCGDRLALADALVRVLDDDALRARLGVTGRQRALAYGWPRVTETVLGVYDAVLGRAAVAA